MQNKNLYSIFLSVLFFSAPAMAANYYINSRAGDDTNTGTTKEQPWKSLADLEKKKFLPGGYICLSWKKKLALNFVFNQ